MSLCGGNYDTFDDFDDFEKFGMDYVVDVSKSIKFTSFSKFKCLCGKMVNCFMCPKYVLHNYAVKECGRLVTGIWKQYDDRYIKKLDKLDIRRLPFIEKTGYDTFRVIMVCSYECKDVKQSISKLKLEYSLNTKRESEILTEQEDIRYYGKITNYKHINPNKYNITYKSECCHVCNKILYMYRICCHNNDTFNNNISKSYKLPDKSEWTRIQGDNKPKHHKYDSYILCSICYIMSGRQ